MSRLTHLDDKGGARMVDVGGKAETDRVARAEGHVRMTADALSAIQQNRVGKGSVLTTAQVAGIMAAKKTAELIPLCHPLPVTKAAVELTADQDLPGIRVTAEVRTSGRTGVEMEALTAVAVACLTIYDMVKAIDKGMIVSGIRLTLKDGGKSGRYEAK